MLFPMLNQMKVIGYSPLLTVSIKSHTREIFTREYYKVKYRDKTELVFMTTNEMDFNFNPRFLKDEFCLILDFEQLVAGFENSEFINLLIDNRFNSPPKYIYYDIVLINDFIKSAFLTHLRESILGYTEDDFTKHEISQLKKWFTCLKEAPTIY